MTIRRTGLRVGQEFWYTLNGKRTGYKVLRTSAGVDRTHALVRNETNGKTYRVNKATNGRPFGKPRRLGQ